MGSMSWGGAPDRLDPDYFLSEMFHSRRTARGGLNFGFYRNAEFANLEPQDLRTVVPNASPKALDLLRRLLVFNPAQRIKCATARHGHDPGRGVAANRIETGRLPPYLPESVFDDFLGCTYDEIKGDTELLSRVNDGADDAATTAEITKKATACANDLQQAAVEAATGGSAGG